MFCAGLAMVRNEADVIELWARYNLRVLDHLHVIDHGSHDNTVEVIEQLQAEGLPITLHHWRDVAYTQAELMLKIGRSLAQQGGIDFFVPLDADELLGTDRAGLHAALQALRKRTGYLFFDALPATAAMSCLSCTRSLRQRRCCLTTFGRLVTTVCTVIRIIKSCL